MNQQIKFNEALENVRGRLFKACNLLGILKGIDAHEDTFNMGHEDIIKTIDDYLQGTFDPLEDISKALGGDSADFKEIDGVWTYKGFPVSEVEKLDQESVELALQYHELSEENKIRFSVELDRIELEHGKGTTDTTQEETEDEANNPLDLPATPSVKVEQILCLCHALDNYITENPESGIVGAIEDAAKVLVGLLEEGV